MIISHKYKFIFVKTYKTASTSIEVYLSQHCAEDDVLTEIIPAVAGHRPRNNDFFYNHMSAIEIRERVGEGVWDSYFKFCVERNPWDKVLSYYWMECSRSGWRLDFDEFVIRNQIGFNWPLYSDRNMEGVVVDKVLRYESLNEDLSVIFEELGIPWTGSLEVRAKSEYRKDRRHYRDVLKSHQAAYIGRRFVKEIKWHGYQY